MRTIVLDSGALIALERRDRRMLALQAELIDARSSAYVPAGVVAQVWRGSPRQHAVVKLLRSEILRVDPLSEERALQIGLLLAASGTSDVVDAHVALLGHSLGAIVLTSDPHDLSKLDPSLDLITV